MLFICLNNIHLNRVLDMKDCLLFIVNMQGQDRTKSFYRTNEDTTWYFYKRRYNLELHTQCTCNCAGGNRTQSTSYAIKRLEAWRINAEPWMRPKILSLHFCHFLKVLDTAGSSTNFSIEHNIISLLYLENNLNFWYVYQYSVMWNKITLQTKISEKVRHPKAVWYEISRSKPIKYEYCSQNCKLKKINW